MEPIFQTENRRAKAGFSLAEVTLSVGIVASVLLPILGLLVGGAQLETTAQDRVAAADLAMQLVELATVDPSGHLEVHFIGSGSSQDETKSVLELSFSGSEVKFASFDLNGSYLGEITEGDFQNGMSVDRGALYLAKLELNQDEESSGSVQERPKSLWEYRITLETPATGASQYRERFVFPTRLAAP
jgi:type II secretory pathway pseudopilin PulG